MELNGFMIGPEIKTLFKIKVGTLIAEHPVGNHIRQRVRARPLATRAGLAGGRKVYQLRPFAHMPGVEIVFPSSFPITQHSQASPRSSNRMETDREGTLMKLPNP